MKTISKHKFVSSKGNRAILHSILATAAMATPVATGALVVTPTNDATVLASSLLGSGASLIGAPTYFGGTTSAGLFTGGLAAGFEFDAGILFSTGNAVDVVGPNSAPNTSTGLGLPGDTDLNALISSTTFDASGLIFNFETISGSLFFNFIFGSEEYLEFVGSINDVFALFLILDADPATPGHQPGAVLNLAVVPGTSDIISINSVNPDSNSSFYRDNASGAENHELDGRTTTLTAVAEDIGPGEHKIKIAIADTTDDILDSVVFLQSGSFGGQITPVGGAFATLPFLIANRQIETMAVNGAYQDINSRLFRLRSGFRGMNTAAQPAATASAKDAVMGASAKGTAVSCVEVSRPWEVFGSISYQNGDFEQDIFGANGIVMPGYELELFHGTAGMEYDINPNFSVGGAFIGTDGDADFDNGSYIDLRRHGIGVYGSYYRENAIPSAGIANAFHADLLYGYSMGDYDTRRKAGAAKFSGSTDASTHLVELNAGLSFLQNNFRHGPIVGLSWQDGEVDGFTEKGPGGLTYGDTDVESLVSSVGYQASYAIETSAGLVIPQFRAAWEHEFEDQSFSLLGTSVGGVDEDSFVLGAGVLWQFYSNAYAVLDYQARLGDEVDTYQATLRVGVSF